MNLMFLASMSGTDIAMKLIAVIGGLGVFLFGIDLMGNTLKVIAGDRMKVFIEKTTNTPLKGILVGALVTILIQSSSGTTALAVGLVRAGLLPFPQAIGIIMGANIGTTVTSFIVGIPGVGEFSLLFVGVGALVIFFFKKDNIKQIGNILLGLGLLFFGLELMGDSLKEILANFENQVKEIFTFVESIPVLGLFIGTIVTAIVQSSAATVSIAQILYEQGTIGLYAALPILLGCNIGTTITAIFAATGGGTQAKRTALVHALFNILGALLFMVLLWPYALSVEWFEDVFLGGVAQKWTLSFAHVIFNVVTTFVLFFFIKQMQWFATKIIKDTEIKEEQIADELLDYTLITKSPVLALSFTKKAIDYMTDCVHRYVCIAREYSFTKNDNYVDEGQELEKMINCLDKRIHDYLVKLTISDLNKSLSTTLSKYLDQIKDLERVGDHCTNIMEFFQERYEKNMSLSDDGTQDLEQIYDALLAMNNGVREAIRDWSVDEATKASEYEDEIDKLEDVFHQRHIHRVNSGACSFINTEHYVEILANIERMGDHFKNICDRIAQDEYCKYDEFAH